MKIINRTGTEGPYPGMTWEKLHGKKEALFDVVIPRKIEDDACDHCMGPCSPRFTCCSKACWNAQVYENECDGRAEARGS